MIFSGFRAYSVFRNPSPKDRLSCTDLQLWCEDGIANQLFVCIADQWLPRQSLLAGQGCKEDMVVRERTSSYVGPAHRVLSSKYQSKPARKKSVKLRDSANEFPYTSKK